MDQIFVAQIIPRVDDDGIHVEAVNALNDVIATFGDSQVTIVDQNSAFLDSNGQPDAALLWDGVHPTVEGQQKIAKNWFDAILRWRVSEGDYAIQNADQNGNGVIDAADFDFVIDIVKSSASGAPVNMDFDFDSNGVNDQQDLRFFIKYVVATSIGDSNVDGVFNSADFVAVFQNGEYEDGIDGNSTWAEGDWNGDGDFDSADLVFAFEDDEYVPF